MKKNNAFIIFILTLLIIIATTLYFWQNTFNITSANFSWPLSYSVKIAVASLLGQITAIFLLLQFALIGRLSLIEKSFGLDKLARLHKLNGYFVFVLLFTHPVMEIIFRAAQNQKSLIAQYFSLIQNWEDVLKASIGMWLLVITIIASITIVRRKLKYEWWHFVHLGNYLALLLVAGHQLHGSSSFSLSWKVFWIGLYLTVLLPFAWYRFAKPLLKFYKHRFYIEKIENEGAANSVYISGYRMSEFKFKAGQFFILRFLQKGYWYEAHPFSASQNYNGSQLRITVKPLGDFTNKISNLKSQTQVLIEGPYGTFTLKSANSGRKLLFIAGGIGITPIYSLIQEALQIQHREISLIYANKTFNDIVFYNEIEALKKTHSPNLKVSHILSGDKKENFASGFITEKFLRELCPDFSEREIFVCGPPKMLNSMLQILMDLDVSRKQIHFEVFEL